MLNQWYLTDPSAPSQPDGGCPTQLVGRAGEAICAPLHGKYFTQCMRGNVFFFSTVGMALTGVNTLASGTAFLFNPAGSGILAVPLKYQLGLVTTATETGCACLSYATQLGGDGTQFATGGPIQNPSTQAAGCARLGFGAVPKARCITSAPNGIQTINILKTIGLSLSLPGSPGAANNFWQTTEYFDGELILSPGSVLIFTGLGTTASASMSLNLVWEEVPI